MQKICLRADSNCTARDEVSFSGHDEISAKASATASCKLEKTLTLSCRSTHLVAQGRQPTARGPDPARQAKSSGPQTLYKL